MNRVLLCNIIYNTNKNSMQPKSRKIYNQSDISKYNIIKIQSNNKRHNY